MTLIVDALIKIVKIYNKLGLFMKIEIKKRHLGDVYLCLHSG
jgi:hypothetical protein